jgi:Protein of unknown function (DUF2752)
MDRTANSPDHLNTEALDTKSLERSRHRQMLIICALAVAAAPLLKVVPEERVAVRGVNVVLPPSCPSRTIFNISCPGCGLTRSFVYFVRGEWEDSVRSNRVGWILMLAVALQIPYRLYALYGSGRYLLGARASWWFGLGLIAMLIGNWVVGIIARGSV